MTTSWTEADIASLEAAINGGTLRVRFGDREVQYQSMADMLKLLQYMKDTVAVAAGRHEQDDIRGSGTVQNSDE
jgi:hypothetical protein